MSYISSSFLGLYFATNYNTIAYPQLLKFFKLFKRCITIYLYAFAPPSSAKISFRAHIAF